VRTGCAPSFGPGSDPGNTGTLVIFFLIVILLTPPYFRPSWLTRSSTPAGPAETDQGRRRISKARGPARSSRSYTSALMLEDAENFPFFPILSHVQDAFQAGKRSPQILTPS
jgi:hypothetical protein